MLLAFSIYSQDTLATNKETSENSIAQFGELYFNSVDEGEQLISGIVTAVIQDKTGFVWIGTQQGLFRYDGIEFKRYSYKEDEPNSLNNNYVTGLWASPSGKIWIGTYIGGVDVFDPTTETFFHINQNTKPFGLLDDAVKQVSGYNDDHVLIPTDAGLHIIHQSDYKIDYIDKVDGCEPVFETPRIRYAYVDHKATLWIGGYTGLCKVPNYQKQLNQMVIEGETIPELDGINVQIIVEDSLEQVWVGTVAQGLFVISDENGVNHVEQIDNSVNQSLPLSGSWVKNLALVDGNQLWAATVGDGISILDIKTKEVRSHVRHDISNKSSINMDVVTALEVDQSGLVWVGTWGAGLNLFNPKSNAIRTLKHSPNKQGGLSHPNIQGIIERRPGEYWFGTFGGGIDVLDVNTGEMKNINPKTDSTVPEAIALVNELKVEEDVVWIGTSTYLYRYDPVLHEFQEFAQKQGLQDANVFAMEFDENQNLWVGTAYGVYKKLATNNQLIPVKSIARSNNIMDDRVVSIQKTKHNKIWIAASSGLFYTTSDSNELYPISEQAGTAKNLTGGVVFGVHENQLGELWVSTDKNTFVTKNWRDGDTRFETIEERFGKPNFCCANFIEDNNGNIWSTSHLINPTKNEIYLLDKSVGYDVGFVWAGAAINTSSGHILRGGSEGVAIIDPKKFSQWDYQPNVVFTKIQLDNKTINTTEKNVLILEPETKVVRAQFASLDYLAPQKIRYRYKLEGFDEEWNYTNYEDPRITYTNLSPGDYTLQVEATNSSGQWSENTLALGITQLPNWYQAYWFFILVILVIVVFVWAILKWRIRQLNQQKVVLERKVKERTVQLEVALKEVERLSLTDQLTGANNRHYLDKVLPKELARLKRANSLDEDQKLLGFLMLDIDFFKKFNDEYGHEAGDSVLQEFSKTLSKICRENDMFIRMGGEEFLIISEVPKVSDLAYLAKRICSDVAAGKTELSSKEKVSITCSIGGIAYGLQDDAGVNETLRCVLKYADELLYEVKSQGRNNWKIATLNSISDSPVLI